MLPPGIDAERYRKSLCHKVPYPSSDAAQQSMGRLRTKQRKKGRRVGKQVRKSYRCGFCGYWHLTSQSR